MEVKGDFFGWGVGGAGNMRLIAEMLRDLGFSRVAVLLDANRSELIPELSQMFPEYRFFTIPANDVRSKPPLAEKPPVNGLVDKHGLLRNKYKDTVIDLFSKLNEYLSNRTL